MPNRQRRWIFFILAIGVGIAAGVFVGYSPVAMQTENAEPQTLRIDYLTDYTLMLAELYQHEGDAAMAAARLIYMGASSPIERVETAIAFAQGNQYSMKDLQLMLNLADAIRNLNLEPESIQ